MDGELIYLLPQPDAQLGVLEQNPAYPEVKPYLGQGLVQLMLTLLAVLVFSFLWDGSPWNRVFGPQWPGLGLASLCIVAVRHAGRLGTICVLVYRVCAVPHRLIAPVVCPTVLADLEC